MPTPVKGDPNPGAHSSYHYIPTEYVCIIFVAFFSLSTSTSSLPHATILIPDCFVSRPPNTEFIVPSMVPHPNPSTRRDWRSHRMVRTPLVIRCTFALD